MPYTHNHRTTTIELRQPYKAIYYIVQLSYNLVMLSMIWSAGIMIDHVFPQPEFAIPYLPYMKWIAERSTSVSILIPFYLVGLFAIFIIGAKLPGTRTVKELKHG